MTKLPMHNANANAPSWQLGLPVDMDVIFYFPNHEP